MLPDHKPMSFQGKKNIKGLIRRLSCKGKRKKKTHNKKQQQKAGLFHMLSCICVLQGCAEGNAPDFNPPPIPPPFPAQHLPAARAAASHGRSRASMCRRRSLSPGVKPTAIQTLLPPVAILPLHPVSACLERRAGLLIKNLGGGYYGVNSSYL